MAPSLSSLVARHRLRLERPRPGALPAATRFAALGLIERSHREVLRATAGEAYAKAEEMLPELLNTATDLVLLHDASDRLVAFSASRQVEEETLQVRYVLELHIDEEHRRKGLGRALVADMREAAEREGSCGLMLTVDARNREAAAFYAVLGFQTSPCSPSACAPSSLLRARSLFAGASYELLVLLWEEGARATLARRGAEARAELQQPCSSAAVRTAPTEAAAPSAASAAPASADEPTGTAAPTLVAAPAAPPAEEERIGKRGRDEAAATDESITGCVKEARAAAPDMHEPLVCELDD